LRITVPFRLGGPGADQVDSRPAMEIPGIATSMDMLGRAQLPYMNVCEFKPPVRVAPDTVPLETGEIDAANVKVLPVVPRSKTTCLFSPARPWQIILYLDRWTVGAVLLRGRKACPKHKHRFTLA
jgi:hypothetical protein